MPSADPSALYGLPLDEFVTARGVLAKALRGSGDTEEAARVAALRKPSVAAWTVNQIIRTQHRAVAALFDAGDALRRAQSELLAGSADASALREAARGEREAVDELAAVARGLLSSEGQEPTQATLDRVSETLHAAALDEDVRARVEEGCLDRELRQVGFGASGSSDSAPPSPGRRRGSDRAGGAGGTGGTGGGGGAGGGGAGAKSTKATRAPAQKGAADRAAAKRAAADRAEAEQAERERAGRLKSARKAEAEARRLAERAARELDAAQERRDRSASVLRDGEDALEAARERSEAAAHAHRRTQETLEDV